LREAWCAGRRAERRKASKAVTRHFAGMAWPLSRCSKELLDFDSGVSMMCGQFPKKSGTTNEGNVQQSLAITQRTLANSSPHCSDFP